MKTLSNINKVQIFRKYRLRNAYKQTLTSQPTNKQKNIYIHFKQINRFYKDKDAQWMVFIFFYCEAV